MSKDLLFLSHYALAINKSCDCYNLNFKLYEPHLTQEVEDEGSLVAHETREQLRYPWQPLDWRHSHRVLVYCFG
jgi:hypothetical protein